MAVILFTGYFPQFRNYTGHMLQINKQDQKCLLTLGWGGGTAIYGLYRYAAVKGMVFKQFTLG